MTDEEYNERMQVYMDQQREKTTTYKWVTLLFLALAFIGIWASHELSVPSEEAYELCEARYNFKQCQEILR